MHESAGQARGTGGQDLRRVETPPAMHASTRIDFPIFQLIYNACFGTSASSVVSSGNECVEEVVKGGDPAIANNDEVGSGIGRCLARPA